MGKMIGYLEGADVYLIIALLVFMLVFLVVTIQLVIMSKKQANTLANLPLSNAEIKPYEN